MEKKLESVLAHIVDTAQHTPEKLCLVDLKHSYTYAQATDLCLRMASLLRAEGLLPGEKVLVVAAQTAHFLLTCFAAQWAGGVFVPLEKSLGPDRIAEIAAITGARRIFSQKAVDIPGLRCEGIEAFAKRAAQAEAPAPYPLPRGEDDGEILFTTGTTGTSKGVAISFAASAAMADNVRVGLEMTPDNVELVTAPINHAFGLRRCYSNLRNGSTVALLDGVVFTQHVLRMLREQRVTAITIVPAAAALLLRMAGDALSEFADQIAYIQMSGANFPEQTKQDFLRVLPHTRLYNFYGSSEAGCACCIDYRANAEKFSCIGKPTAHSAIHFVDEQWNPKEATRENPGFLAVSGAIVMRGYYEDPETTRKTLRDGVVYTRDLAYPDEEGFIYLLGRQDNVVNVGGSKVSLEEVEGQAILLPGIADCACVPIDDPLTEKALLLLVVMEQGVALDEKEISAGLAQSLERYKIPRVYQEVPGIPKTYNGKLQRAELAKLIEERDTQNG